jgi:hypothetical protein
MPRLYHDDEQTMKHLWQLNDYWCRRVDQDGRFTIEEELPDGRTIVHALQADEHGIVELDTLDIPISASAAMPDADKSIAFVSLPAARSSYIGLLSFDVGARLRSSKKSNCPEANLDPENPS